MYRLTVGSEALIRSVRELTFKGEPILNNHNAGATTIPINISPRTRFAVDVVYRIRNPFATPENALIGIESHGKLPLTPLYVK